MSRLISIRLRDTTLASIEAGSGEALLFVHGSLGSMRDFSAQLDHFSATHRVISYSRRSHPPNAAHESGLPYTIARHAADMADVVRELGIAPATVIGSSYGGYAALFCAIRHPGIVGRLVLCEPPILPILTWTAEGREALDRFESGTLTPARAAFVAGDIRLGVGKFFDGVTGRAGMFALLSPSARERLMEAGEALRLEFLTPPDEYMPPISEEEIRSVKFPVLLIGGQKSPRYFALIADELERLLPDSRRATVPGAGHAMYAANPARFNRFVIEFISSGSGRDRA